MAAALLPVAKIAGGALAAKLFAPKGKKVDISKLVRDFLASNPGAVNTPEDYAAADRYRAAGTESIGQGVAQAGGQAMRRFAARGLAGPASEQALGDIAQGGAVARQGLSRDVAGILENRRQSALDFARNKLFTSFGAQIGEAGQQRNINAGQQAAYWNSAIPLLGQLSGLKFPASGASSPTYADMQKPDYGWGG